MLYPSIDDMLKKIESKYSLVVAASKRARLLKEGKRSDLMKPRSHKYVGIALEEIHNGLIEYERVKS
jgi:DNA-directed RNA polymerase subunit omega